MPIKLLSWDNTTKSEEDQMSRRMLTPLNLLTRASDPSSGIEGDVYFNTSDMTIRVHNGVVFVPISGGNNSSIGFYEHTHGSDGEVDSVYPIPLTQEELGTMGLLQVSDGNVDKAQNLITQTITGGTVESSSTDYTESFDDGTI